MVAVTQGLPGGVDGTEWLVQAGRVTGEVTDAALTLGSRVQTPLTWNALELMLATVVEDEAAPRDEVLHRWRDDDFPRPSDPERSSADHDGEPSGPPVLRLIFA